MASFVVALNAYEEEDSDQGTGKTERHVGTATVVCGESEIPAAVNRLQEWAKERIGTYSRDEVSVTKFVRGEVMELKL